MNAQEWENNNIRQTFLAAAMTKIEIYLYRGVFAFMRRFLHTYNILYTTVYKVHCTIRPLDPTKSSYSRARARAFTSVLYKISTMKEKKNRTKVKTHTYRTRADKEIERKTGVNNLMLKMSEMWDIDEPIVCIGRYLSIEYWMNCIVCICIHAITFW